jgi:hypothetical protein
MFEEKGQIKLFVKTTKQVIKELEDIKNIDLDDIINEVENAFDNYNVDGIEDLVGFENWSDLSNDKDYILNLKVDHEDAYEFSIYTSIKNDKASITNVL